MSSDLSNETIKVELGKKKIPGRGNESVGRSKLDVFKASDRKAGKAEIECSRE